MPEIYDGIIEIKAVSRDPGSRAKMAVISRDSSIDPVGACVGMRGSRVQAVVQELQGEKIDIIPWSSQAATFVVNALAPAEVTKVVMDEEAGRVEVVVPDEQLSLAIGRRGQNVRLASQLTRWDIDILTEAEESERRQEEFRRRTGLFVEALDVDDMIAGLLVTEGFTTVEELAFTPPDELAEIEGFDETVAGELISRADLFLQRRDAELDDKRQALGVSDEIAGMEGLTPPMLVQLGEKGVRTLDDLADLAGDELIEIVGEGAMDEEAANAIIMAARAHWFDGGDAPAAPRGWGERRRLTPTQLWTKPRKRRKSVARYAAASSRASMASGRRCCVLLSRRTVISSPDLSARLPGRGFWLSARADVLEAAQSRGAFARAARGPVIVPPDLVSVLQAGLTRRVVDFLGLARRAGQAVSGFAKVREALTAGHAQLVVQASDGSSEECHRLLSGARAIAAVRPLTAAELGAVFGRDHVVHVAITPGRLAEALIVETTRLAGVSGHLGGTEKIAASAGLKRRGRIERTGE